MNITILNVVISTQPAKKPGGKAYQLAEVAFKNNSFGGSVQGKKITSYSKAYGAVSTAQPGEIYDVITEKNGEFVEWVSLQKTNGAAVPAASNVPAVLPQGKSFTPAGRDFETSDERAKKQVYIVRQSSISAAVAILSVGAKAPPSSAAVIKLARELEGFVFEQPKIGSDTSRGGITGFDDVPDFDPSFNAGEPNIE
jgi:hypothetical protein